MQRFNYLVYVTGSNAKGEPSIVPVSIEASGADIQRGNYLEDAKAAAKKRGVTEVRDVFFADTVHNAVESGLDLQGDEAGVCVALHNEFCSKGRDHIKSPPSVNDEMWRVADAFHSLQMKVIPGQKKISLLESLGSNQPTWDRAVYGAYRTNDSGKREVEKLQVDDLSTLRGLEKAGVNMEFMFRVLSKMGVLEPVLRLIERRVRRLAELREKLHLDELGEQQAEAPESLKISTKRAKNEARTPI